MFISTAFKTSLITGVCAMALIALPASLNAADGRTAMTAKEKEQAETYKFLNLYGDVFERVRSEYVEEVTDKDLVENSLNGMLSSLDPHSGYMNAEEFRSMTIETRGEFGGLGIEVTMENGLVKVVSPIDDTPAYEAGIKAGDLFVELDGEQVMGLTLSEAVKKMRGKIGTDITLTVLREGVSEPLTIKITRDLIRIKSVRHRTEDNVGVIRITTFNQQTYKGLKKAFKEINAELGEDLVGYVIDLRNNPGGLLDQAIAVSDAFLESGEIVSTRGRTKEDTRRDNATPGDMAKGLPVIALINGGSASASEIVAGALQDHKRGIVMGTKSFGKGSVQSVITIPGHGAIRLTTARYYTPSGRSIQAKGIEPDIVVEEARVIEKLDKKFDIHEADLRGALDKNKDTKDKKDKKAEKKDVKKDKDGNEIIDYQMTRAIDLLQGISLHSKSKK